MATEIDVRIDRSSPVPLYHQLAEQLAAAIDDGALHPGDAFENEVAMGQRLGLSRPTVRRAIAELAARGLLVRRRGVGTTVANRTVHRKAELTSLWDDLTRAGAHPTTTVLSLEVVQDERVAAMLDLPADSELLAVVRLRLSDGEPLAVLRNWLPPATSTSPATTSRPRACMPCCAAAGPVRSWPARDQRPAAEPQRAPAPADAGQRTGAHHDPQRLRRGRSPGRVRRPLLPRLDLHDRGHGRRALRPSHRGHDSPRRLATKP